MHVLQAPHSVLPPEFWKGPLSNPGSVIRQDSGAVLRNLAGCPRRIVRGRPSGKIFAETSPDGRVRLSFQLHTELEDILDCRAALEIREKETGKPVFSAAYPVKLGPGETEYVFDAQVDSPELWIVSSIVKRPKLQYT